MRKGDVAIKCTFEFRVLANSFFLHQNCIMFRYHNYLFLARPWPLSTKAYEKLRIGKPVQDRYTSGEMQLAGYFSTKSVGETLHPSVSFGLTIFCFRFTNFANVFFCYLHLFISFVSTLFYARLFYDLLQIITMKEFIV